MCATWPRSKWRRSTIWPNGDRPHDPPATGNDPDEEAPVPSSDVLPGRNRDTSVERNSGRGSGESGVDASDNFSSHFCGRAEKRLRIFRCHGLHFSFVFVVRLSLAGLV